ncbi:MAG: hypothetical protein P8184_12695 [Calditrichia bacterium]
MIKKFLMLALAIIYFCSFSTIKSNEPNNHLIIRTPDRSLFWYYLENHVYDPENIAFSEIENAFLQYDPDLVLVEGGNNVVSRNAEEAIRIGGESRFVAFLGFKTNKIVQDIEPPFEKQLEFLLSKNNAQSVYAMYLLRLLNSDKSRYLAGSREIVDIYQHCEEYLNHLDKVSGRTNKIDKQFVDLLTQAYAKTDFAHSRWYEIDYDSVLYDPDGALYVIRDEITNYRNLWLIRLIEEKRLQFRKIFIMMGSGHLMKVREKIIEMYR